MDESAYSTLLKYVENTEYKDTENLTESETRGSQEPVIIFFWRPNYFESTNIAESNDIWHSCIVFMTIKFWKWCL
jgi:hypothetical protein